MNRRTLFRKAALLAVAAPIAALSAFQSPEPVAASAKFADYINIQPYPLTEGVAPPPAANISHYVQFKAGMNFVPIRVLWERANRPTLYDPMGQYGFLSYKYVGTDGQTYGNFIQLSASVDATLTDDELRQLGLELGMKEIRQRGITLPIICVDSFQPYYNRSNTHSHSIV